MTYTTQKVGNRLQKKYLGLMAVAKPQYRPTVSNLHRKLSAGFPQHIKHLLSKRKRELFPGLLEPFASKQDIYRKAGQLADEWRLILSEKGSKRVVGGLWNDFCRIHNLGSLKMPALNKLGYPGYWHGVLRRKLRKASFIYSLLAEGADQYVPISYLKYALSLRRRGVYLTRYGELTYSQAQAYRQYMRCCQYYARSLGVADLAEKRGLSPYAISITPMPKYQMHGSHWEGETPEQVSSLLTQAYRKFTDSMRHAGIDLDCIRVVEPQESGTPHLHLLLFTNDIAKVMPALKDAFMNKVEVSGSTGIHCQNAYDVGGEIRYMLKTLWGKLKYDAEYADEIMAWGEEGAHRRFGITSTTHKFPSVEIWELARKGKFQVEHHKICSKHLREDVRINEAKINTTNDRMNAAAKSGDYAAFCLAYWDATASDQQLKQDLLKSLTSSTFSACSQLRLIYQEDYTYRVSNASPVFETALEVSNSNGHDHSTMAISDSS